MRKNLLAGGVFLIAASGFFYQQTKNAVAQNKSARTPYIHQTKVAGEKRLAGPPPASRFKLGQNLPDPVPSPHPPGSVEDGKWVAVRIAAIHDLEWFEDSPSLLKILSELRNPVTQIRAAALEATRAFGSRDAIPYLVARAEETGDLLEQKELRDLIEHLRLPTVIEELEEGTEK